MWLRLASNLQSSCLSLLSARTQGVWHHIQLYFETLNKNCGGVWKEILISFKENGHTVDQERVGNYLQGAGFIWEKM
jgi:hypothetical protein